MGPTLGRMNQISRGKMTEAEPSRLNWAPHGLCSASTCRRIPVFPPQSQSSLPSPAASCSSGRRVSREMEAVPLSVLSAWSWVRKEQWASAQPHPDAECVSSNHPPRWCGCRRPLSPLLALWPRSSGLCWGMRLRLVAAWLVPGHSWLCPPPRPVTRAASFAVCLHAPDSVLLPRGFYPAKVLKIEGRQMTKVCF